MHVIKPRGLWLKYAKRADRAQKKRSLSFVVPTKAGVYDEYMKSKKKPAPKKRREGFTLIELMTCVGVVGILSAISYPIYAGYVDNTKANLVKDKLRATHMQEQEYFASHASYYAPSASCAGDGRVAINASLFGGQNVLNEQGVTYCLTQTAGDNFLMRASYTGSDGTATSYTINQSGATNF
ncbi:MAG: prepilin-type N-terminal cleavage/methylation domain-containing protein [Rickettsiales bacterium]